MLEQTSITRVSIAAVSYSAENNKLMTLSDNPQVISKSELFTSWFIALLSGTLSNNK